MNTKASEPAVMGCFLLTLNEVAEVIGIDPQRVREMVAKGYVAPTVPGEGGRGHTHRFGLVESYALTMAVSYHMGTRAQGRLVRWHVAHYLRWSPGAVLWSLGLRRDALAEEDFAKALFPYPPNVAGEEPTYEEALRHLGMQHALARLCDKVRAKLSADGRITNERK